MLYGAGNQKEDIVATRGVSRSRTEDSRRSSKFTRTRFGPGFGDVRDNKTQDEGADEARATVKGQHWKAGVCDDYANVTLDYLREHLGGHTLNKMGKDKHAFVIIGDMQTESDDQLVVADPWPTRPQACLWSDHFCYSPGEDRPAPKRSYEAPGKKHKDVRGELEFGKKKAARSSKQSPVGLQQTVDQARKGDDIWFERTTTRNGKAIFYVDPQWGREEKARRREAFRQTLLESMHLGKKARKKLGI
jgi:hypothetical protein